MMNELKKLTEYRLSGEKTEIEVSFGGEPELRYNGKVFRGRGDLQIWAAPLGTLLSVILESAPDSHETSLLLIVPDGARPEGAKSIAVNTFATVCTRRSSIAGPDAVSGQTQKYDMVPLRGNAW